MPSIHPSSLDRAHPPRLIRCTFSFKIRCRAKSTLRRMGCAEVTRSRIRGPHNCLQRRATTQRRFPISLSPPISTPPPRTLYLKHTYLYLYAYNIHTHIYCTYLKVVANRLFLPLLPSTLRPSLVWKRDRSPPLTVRPPISPKSIVTPSWMGTVGARLPRSFVQSYFPRCATAVRFNAWPRSSSCHRRTLASTTTGVFSPAHGTPWTL